MHCQQILTGCRNEVLTAGAAMLGVERGTGLENGGRGPPHEAGSAAVG